MVPGVGVEPTRPCGQRILSPRRLPFRHPGPSPSYRLSPTASCSRPSRDPAQSLTLKHFASPPLAIALSLALRYGSGHANLMSNPAIPREGPAMRSTLLTIGMVGMALIPGLPDEAVVLIQTGKLWRISLSSAFAPYLFGDITSQVTQVSQGGEEGLLGIAFSPQFQTDGRLHLFYNRKPAANNIPCPISEPPGYNIYNYNTLSRFTVSGNVLNPASEEQLISLADCFGWHNGGQLFFRPDGYLYLSTGDEGNIHDPHQNGQNLDMLFAKLLRLDVSGASGYTSPPDNPFVGVAGRDEIWAMGFRNPWRFSFDPVTGDIWLTDVGQYNWEEVNHIEKGGNYGW